MVGCGLRKNSWASGPGRHNVPSMLDSTKATKSQKDIKRTFLRDLATFAEGPQKDVKRTFRQNACKHKEREGRKKDVKRTLKGHKGR